MKSWDLQMCDRASTITHVDREEKNSANYSNEIFYFFVGLIVAFWYILMHFKYSKYVETTWQDSYTH